MGKLRVFTAFSNQEFQDISGFENLYAVSKQGTVISIPRKIWNGKGMVAHQVKALHGHKNSKGYIQIALYKNNKRHILLIHRLVAEAFIPNPNKLPQVNHKDGNKENNVLENLEWCDNSYNQTHAWAIGLQKSHIAGRKRRKVRLLKNEEELLFDSIASACRFLRQTNNANLYRVLNKSKSYNTIKGYKAEYV